LWGATTGRAVCGRTLCAHSVIPRPRRGRGNPFSFDGATDCHVGPVALLAMTDHSVAGVGWCDPVGLGILGAPSAGVPCVPTPSFRGPGGAVGIRSLLTGLRIATSGLWPSSQ